MVAVAYAGSALRSFSSFGGVWFVVLSSGMAAWCPGVSLVCKDFL